MSAAVKVAFLLLTACALASKSPPREIRYFSPERAEQQATPAPAGAHARLRLGRVVAGANLRLAIVHRESAVELAPYETLRWTETPDAYVRRALVRALFDARGLEQAVGGEAPTLDVELVAFEEVARGTQRAGRVELRYQLRDDSRVLARGTIAIERPAAGATIDLVVPAIGAAMTAASDELAERVATELYAQK